LRAQEKQEKEFLALFALHIPVKKKVFVLPSDWDCKVEDGQHFRSCFFDEHVADDGGRDGRVAGLADADDGSHRKKRTVVLKTILKNVFVEYN
jgi:hypothetical protein